MATLTVGAGQGFATIAAAIVAQIDHPLRPGARAEQFRLERTHQRYLDVLRDM